MLDNQGAWAVGGGGVGLFPSGPIRAKCRDNREKDSSKNTKD